MTPPFPEYPPRAVDPGTAPLSRVRGVAAEPATSEMPVLPLRPGPGGGGRDASDTGPLPPARGAVPVPPPPPPASQRPPAVGPDPPETQASPGRAGRNLPAAVAVGVSLGVLVVLSLVIWRPLFLLVLTGAVVVSVVELGRALRAGKFRPPLMPLVVGTVAMIGLAWSRGPTGLVLAFFFTVLAVLFWRLADGPAGYLADAAAGALVALYVPLLAGFAALLLVPADGAARVLLFIGTVVCNDVGGFAAGVFFGKHAMAPSLSPKKSWEGFAGSVLACVLLATPVIALALDGPWWGGLVFGTAIAATATFGDLAESMIKRDLGIKDMGDLLPGHGGIMDRMDSLLPSAAAAFLLLSVLAPT